MDWISIIKRSWQITWRYKALWVLGVFAGVSGCQASSGGGGGNSGTSFPGTSTGGSSSSGGSTSGMPSFPDTDQLLSTVEQWVPALVAGLVLLVLIGLVWAVFAVAARGGLIAGVNRIEEGGAPTLGELWSSGFSRFWTLVGIDLLLGLPVFVVGIAVMLGVVVPLFGSIAGGAFSESADFRPELFAPACGSLAIGIPLLLVMGFVLGIMSLIAKRYAMLGGQGVFEAAGNSWRFFRARLLDSFLMWLINGALNFVASMVLVIPGVVIGVVVAVPAITGAATGSWGPLAVAIGFAFLLLMVLSFAYNAIWGTYTSALWTIFFRKVSGMEPPVALAASAAAPAAGYGYESQPPMAPQPPVAPPYEAFPAGPPMATPPAAPAPPAAPPTAPEPPAEYPQYPPQPPAPGA